ncbi:MAG: GNAT family N-acetyltransferase [Thermoplasmata archaeon]
MRLEKVEPGDKEEIKAMSSGIWDGNDYIPKVFDTWVKDEGFYKAVLEGNIIGVCKYSRQPGGILWLEGLRIHPDYHGKGYGSDVAGLFHQIVINKEHTALRFMTDVTNAKSIHLAEKRGFSVLLELYHLEFEGSGDPINGIYREKDLHAVRDIVLSSPEYHGYKGLYISNWEAQEFTEELLVEEVKAGNCYSYVREGEIQGVLFINYHKAYGRISIPFLVGSQEAVDKLIRYAMWWSGERGDSFLLLKTPFEEVKNAAEKAGMGLAGFRKVNIFQLEDEQAL